MGHFCPPGSGSTDPIESGSTTLVREAQIYRELKHLEHIQDILYGI